MPYCPALGEKNCPFDSLFPFPTHKLISDVKTKQEIRMINTPFRSVGARSSKKDSRGPLRGCAPQEKRIQTHKEAVPRNVFLERHDTGGRNKHDTRLRRRGRHHRDGTTEPSGFLPTSFVLCCASWTFSMATLIGLCIRVKLLRSLPARFKATVRIASGTHSSEAAGVHSGFSLL